MLFTFAGLGRKPNLVLFFLSMWASVAAQSTGNAPKVGLVQWDRGENPIWSPRLVQGLSRLIEADSGFAGAPALAPLKAQLKRELNPPDLAAGGALAVAKDFAVDHLVHLELSDLTPQHGVVRHKWKLWDAAESWGLALRLTVWDGKSGRVVYDAKVPGTVTVKEKSFWPYREFSDMPFSEQDKMRDYLLDATLSATKDTLARILLGRKFTVPGDSLAGAGKAPASP